MDDQSTDETALYGRALMKHSGQLRQIFAAAQQQHPRELEALVNAC